MFSQRYSRVCVHRSSPVNSRGLVTSAIWALGEIKVLGIYWGKKRKQKQPLCFRPTEGSCVPFRTGHKQALCCWGAGSCNPWVPLATSPADLLLIPLAVNLCCLIHLHLLTFLSLAALMCKTLCIRLTLSGSQFPKTAPSLNKSNIKQTYRYLYSCICMQFEVCWKVRLAWISTTPHISMWSTRNKTSPMIDDLTEPHIVIYILLKSLTLHTCSVNSPWVKTTSLKIINHLKLIPAQNKYLLFLPFLQRN